VKSEFDGIYYYEETDLTKEVSIKYILRSDIEDPYQITEIIGITPTICFKKGEIYSGKELNRKTQKIDEIMRKRGCGIWSLELKGERPSFDEIERVIKELLSILEPKRDLLKQFLDRRDLYTISIFIRVVTNDRFGHILLDNNLLFRLSELCHRIQFTTETSSEYIESIMTGKVETTFPPFKRVKG
jgi:hypothetical protein